jgi:hypothetical protein
VFRKPQEKTLRRTGVQPAIFAWGKRFSRDAANRAGARKESKLRERRDAALKKREMKRSVAGNKKER